MAGGSVYIFGGALFQPRPGPIPEHLLPSLPLHYQPRETNLAALRAKLDGLQETVGAIGLRGMGGIGKTVLAVALARDPSIRIKFSYGVAWLTFGQGASALTKAAELATVITGQSMRFDSLDSAQGQLGELTRDLALLVVLDDIWEPEAADPFSRLGPKCRVLITTRDTRVLTRANAHRHDVGLLTPATARDFLVAASGLPSTDALPTEVDPIIRHCGHLPLALAAAGALIRTGVYSWADALRALEEGAAEELDTSWLPDPAQRNVAVALHISVESLSIEAKACFLACGVFQDDVSIPEATLLCLWSSKVPSQRLAKRMADELEQRSLMARDDQRRYRIHDLYVDYLHHAAAPLSARHADLVARFRPVYPAGWDACPDDGYIVRHLPWHLKQAEQVDELRSMLFHLPWLHHKHACVGINSVIEDYKLLPNDPEVAILMGALTLSVNVLNREPNQLAHQLKSRLVLNLGPSIAKLLNAILASCDLAPEPGPYLTPPGAELYHFDGHAGQIDTVAALSDGRSALSTCTQWTLLLWDTETGAELRRFEKDWRARFLLGLVDGHCALSASDGSTAMLLWNFETGAEMHCFEGHSERINCIAILPDCHRVLSGSNDKTLRLWDLKTGAELHCFKGHTNRISCAAVLPDGRRALSGSDDCTLRLWDLEKGVELRCFSGPGEKVEAVVIVPDGRRALSISLSASYETVLRLWDLETGVELRRFDEVSGLIKAVAVLPDGRRILTAELRTLRLWDVETGSELRRFDGHSGWVRSVVVLPDGRRALSGGDDKTVRLWNLESKVSMRRIEGHTGHVLSVAVLPDGRRALSGSKDCTLRLWDLEMSVELRRFGEHSDYVCAVAVLPDGCRALSSDRHSLRLWDLETGTELRRFDGHSDWINCLAVLPDGRRALSGSDDCTLRLWDLETGVELRRFGDTSEKVKAVAVLPDGRRALSVSYLASHSSRTTLLLWNLETGAELRRFNRDAGCLYAVTVLPDGRRALVGSNDKSLRLLDLETGADLSRFDGHSEWIRSVVVMSDGRRALSGSDDNTLRLWDLETGAQLSHYIGESAFLALAPLQGCERVLTGNELGQVTAFHVAHRVMSKR